MSSAPPPVSVIIPSFNHAKFIDECLGSVLEQGWTDFEVVVVDDGSIDDSVEKIRQFARNDSRIRFETQSNSGAHTALNRAVELSRGELVFVLNSDDAFEANRIASFHERFIAEPNVEMLCSWIRVVDTSGVQLGIKEGYSNMPPWPRPSSGPGLAEMGNLRLALLESNFVSTTSNLAFRRRLYTERGARFLPLRYAHDWEFLLHASRYGSLEMIEEPLVSYRVHDSNTISEGEDSAAGKGDMRYEVMWLVARHCRAVLENWLAESSCDPSDLRARMWRSVPFFECPSLLCQLLLLRGSSHRVPASFDALLDPSHPFSRRARSVLSR